MSINHTSIWRIALPTPLARYFDYLPCAYEFETLHPGVRVKVPFGARKLIGVLLEVDNHTEIELAKLKPALAVIDSYPLLDAKMLQFCQWISDYYHHPIGEVIQTAIPKYLVAGSGLI